MANTTFHHKDELEDNNIMSSHVHIALYDALREAGASEEKARAAAGGGVTRRAVAERRTGSYSSWSAALDSLDRAVPVLAVKGPQAAPRNSL